MALILLVEDEKLLRWALEQQLKRAGHTVLAAPDLATAVVRHGKELSYNNLLDLDSALRLIRAFSSPAAHASKLAFSFAPGVRSFVVPSGLRTYTCVSSFPPSSLE